MKMIKTISKDGVAFNYDLDVTKLPSDARFRALETELAASALTHRSTGYKHMPKEVDTQAYIDAVYRSGDGRSSGVLKPDRDQAEKMLPKLKNKTPEGLAQIGKILKLDGPASTDLDTLARQIADARIAEARAKDAAMKDLLA